MLDDPDTLRTAVEVDLPQVRRNIDECKRSLARYTPMPQADSVRIQRANKAWESAHNWAESVYQKFRDQKLNLEQKQPSREVTFKPWKPGGEVNIYEFFTSYEEWSTGLLSDREKAYRLYHLYLDSSLTSTYEELRSRKGNYQEMKTWLTTKWGAVKPVVDTCLRMIKKLPKPKDNKDLAALAVQSRAIHKQVSDLIHLEASKGVPVPRLSDHMNSNSFLVELFEVLPIGVREKVSDRLADEDVEISNIEGKRYLELILAELRKYYRLLSGWQHQWSKMPMATPSATIYTV
jgi:hypothetical protein